MLTCPTCELKFDRTEHLPKFLPDCGHTICEECLSEILESKKFPKCPECKIPFSSILVENPQLFRTNLALQQIIEIQEDRCEKHHAPKDYVCLIDYQEICMNCVKYDDEHTDHPTKSLKKVHTQAEKKLEEIYQKENEFNKKEQGEFLSILDKSQEKMNELVNNSFDQFQTDLARKKRFLQWDIEGLLFMKQRMTKTSDSQVISLKDEISSSRRALENHVLTKEYLEILEKEVPLTIQKESLKEFTKQLQQSVQEEIAKFLKEKNSILSEQGLDRKKSSDSERLLQDLEIAQRKYFDICFEEDSGTLIITPEDNSHHKELTFFTVKQISDIKKISFNPISTKFSDEMIQALSQIWKNLNHHVKVKITFDENYFEDADLIPYVKFPFWESLFFQNLEIDLTQCSFEEATFLPDILGAALQKSKNLKALGLVLDSTNIDDSTIEAFSNTVLPLLPNLEELSLWLDNTEITSNSIKALCSQSLTKLKGLSLSLQSINLTDHALFALSDVAFKNLSELEGLNLYLANTQITSKGIDDLFKKLSNLAKLEVLSFNLADTRVNDNNIGSLCYYFSKSTSTLQQLYLDLTRTQVSEMALELLCSSLPKQISELELYFSETCTTDLTIQTLVTESLKNMPNLTLLELFLGENGIASEALLTLCSFLKKNDKIKTLTLDLHKTNVNDESICHFIKNSVPSMSALKSCVLDVSDIELEESTLKLVSNLNEMYES